jgi:hypothetical protein
MTKSYYEIPFDEFQSVISRWVYVPFTDEEYENDWEKDALHRWVRCDSDIKELCCKLPIGNGYCIKVFSTFDRKTRKCRGSGRDSIKIVAAQIDTLEPISGAYTHTKRLTSWEANFTRHLSEVLIDLGNDMTCECGAPRVMRKNPRMQINFLGCSTYRPNFVTNCKTSAIRVRHHQ